MTEMCLPKRVKSNALDRSVLDLVFDKWWDDLNTSVQEVLRQPDQSENPRPRSQKELLEEVLGISRAIYRRTRTPSISLQPIQDLVQAYNEVCWKAVTADGSGELIQALTSMRKPLNYLITKPPMSERARTDLATMLTEATTGLELWAPSRNDSADVSRDNVDLSEEDFDDIPF